MNFWDKNKYKLKQAFAVAGMCGITTYNVLNTADMEPLIFTSLLAIDFLRRATEKKSISEVQAESAYPNLLTPSLKQMVTEISTKANISAPPTFIVDSELSGVSSEKYLVLSKFEFGYNSPYTQDEQRGIVAHEIGHLKNGDIDSHKALRLLVTLNIASFALQTFVPMVQHTPSSGQAGYTFLGMAAFLLLKRYASRQREYAADKASAELLGTGKPMAAWLAKAETEDKERHPEMQEMMDMMDDGDPIENFVVDSVASALATHPPTSKRIEILMEEDGRITTSPRTQQATPA